LQAKHSIITNGSSSGFVINPQHKVFSFISLISLKILLYILGQMEGCCPCCGFITKPDEEPLVIIECFENSKPI
jgi:hypothetical protein